MVVSWRFVEGVVSRFLFGSAGSFAAKADRLFAVLDTPAVGRLGDEGRTGSSLVVVADKTVNEGVNVPFVVAPLRMDDDADGTEDGMVLLMIKRGVRLDRTGLVGGADGSEEERMSEIKFVRS